LKKFKKIIKIINFLNTRQILFVRFITQITPKSNIEGPEGDPKLALINKKIFRSTAIIEYFEKWLHIWNEQQLKSISFVQQLIIDSVIYLKIWI
jgi:hypothetical protein